jgi:hypothetical protein
MSTDTINRPALDLADVTGEILEADVKQKRFQLWTNSETHLFVSFSDDQEAAVTSALKDHRSVRVRVKGRTELSPQGTILRVAEITLLSMNTAETVYDPDAPPIEEVLARLAADVPRADWNNLPADLTDNLDHYIYGTPRR